MSRDPLSLHEIETALSFVSPEDRDVWVRMAMAVKAELGEGGFSIWSNWSSQSKAYNPKSAQAVWRSIQSKGGIGIGSLIKAAHGAGWRRDRRELSAEQRRAIEAEGERRARDRKAEIERQEAKRDKARAELRQKALRIVADAERDTHPYLEAKGFPERKELVSDGKIFLPMLKPRRGKHDEIVGFQTIEANGEKKFLPGSAIKGSLRYLGNPGARPDRVWLCEGFATALSIRAALRDVLQWRNDLIVIAFTAGNLAYVGRKSRNCYVIGDHDSWKSDRQKYLAGQKAAWETGKPFWIPDEAGDANDFHLRHGLRILAGELRDFYERQVCGAKRVKPKYERKRSLYFKGKAEDLLRGGNVSRPFQVEA